MRNRDKHASNDSDPSVEEELPRKPITKKQERADGRYNGLDIKNYVHHGRVPVFQRQGEKDCANRRAGEPGEKQEAPRARVDFWNLVQMGDQDWQEHHEDEHMLPEDDHLCVENLIERNTPRAFCAPKRCAQADEPRAISRAARVAVLHFRMG